MAAYACIGNGPCDGTGGGGVSVIIPTYNRRQLLSGAIASVLAQSLPCAEIIVVDDGSQDETANYIATVVHDAGVPIRYLRQENRGPAAARNLGIHHARHRYLAFLDSDDSWHPKKIELQLKRMEECPHFLISHTLEKWLRRGIHLNQKKKHRPRHGDIFDHCLQLCAVGMSTVMVRKELFSLSGAFDESYPCCEDYEFWLRVSSKYPFLLVDEPLTIKQGGREDQLSQQYRIGMDRFRIRALEKLLAQGALDTHQRCATRKELMKKLTIYGNGCVRHGRIEEGRNSLQRAEALLQMIQTEAQ